MDNIVEASVKNNSLNPPEQMKHFAHAYGCLTFIEKPTKKDVKSLISFYKPILEAEI